PWLIVVFKLMKTDRGGRVYYVNESVGIAFGLLIAAIHHAGLVTLTHTPSPMGFLGPLLGRPEHERPFLLLPVGYAAPGCVVPDLARKSIEEVMVWNAAEGA
ncbi:MAG: nitroreductase family protein, partial [Phycisphaerae bacterium]|nr:nitroreductase family protein [Phycisphaerae bacterium]